MAERPSCRRGCTRQSRCLNGGRLRLCSMMKLVGECLLPHFLHTCQPRRVEVVSVSCSRYVCCPAHVPGLTWWKLRVESDHFDHSLIAHTLDRLRHLRRSMNLTGLVWELRAGREALSLSFFFVCAILARLERFVLHRVHALASLSLWPFLLRASLLCPPWVGPPYPQLLLAEHDTTISFASAVCVWRTT